MRTAAIQRTGLADKCHKQFAKRTFLITYFSEDMDILKLLKSTEFSIYETRQRKYDMVRTRFNLVYIPALEIPSIIWYVNTIAVNLQKTHTT